MSLVEKLAFFIAGINISIIIWSFCIALIFRNQNIKICILGAMSGALLHNIIKYTWSMAIITEEHAYIYVKDILMSNPYILKFLAQGQIADVIKILCFSLIFYKVIQLILKSIKNKKVTEIS